MGKDTFLFFFASSLPFLVFDLAFDLLFSTSEEDSSEDDFTGLDLAFLPSLDSAFFFLFFLSSSDSESLELDSSLLIFFTPFSLVLFLLDFAGLVSVKQDLALLEEVSKLPFFSSSSSSDSVSDVFFFLFLGFSAPILVYKENSLPPVCSETSLT